MENTKHNIDVTKEIKAPVHALYDAWVKPEELKQWWKPMHKDLVDVKNDLKEGGHYEYIFADDDFTVDGEYSEVKENERLVYTWNWHLPNEEVNEEKFELTIHFSGDDKSSSIHVIQQSFDNEELMNPHKEGWEKGLNDLKNYVESKVGE